MISTGIANVTQAKAKNPVGLSISRIGLFIISWIPATSSIESRKNRNASEPQWNVYVLPVRFRSAHIEPINNAAIRSNIEEKYVGIERSALKYSRHVVQY